MAFDEQRSLIAVTRTEFKSAPLTRVKVKSQNGVLCPRMVASVTERVKDAICYVSVGSLAASFGSWAASLSVTFVTHLAHIKATCPTRLLIERRV